MQFLSQHPPQSINYKLSPCGARDREGGGRREERGGEGSGLTIAAWADINLSKLMEVSIMLCYGWGDVKDPWTPPLVPLLRASMLIIPNPSSPCPDGVSGFPSSPSLLAMFHRAMLLTLALDISSCLYMGDV